MKKSFLNLCLKLIKNNNSNISEVKLDEIRYGLEGIYLTITKTIFIFLISYLLGIFKEMLIMLIIYNILRITGFGLHAKKSYQCWTSSTLIFILFPLLAKYVVFNIYIKIILGILAIILIYIYAPADTEKHPLINMKKRKIWKYITTINSIILVITSMYISDRTISSLMIFGIYAEVFVILPATYKIFNLKYNNYLSYGLNN